jgi:hypothetical protein
MQLGYNDSSEKHYSAGLILFGERILFGKRNDCLNATSEKLSDGLDQKKKPSGNGPH